MPIQIHEGNECHKGGLQAESDEKRKKEEKCWGVFPHLLSYFDIACRIRKEPVGPDF